MKYLSSLACMTATLLFTAPALTKNIIPFACRSNPYAKVQCVLPVGPAEPSGYEGYLAAIAINGQWLGTTCLLSPNSSLAMDNNDASQAIGEGILHLGSNTLTFYECNTASNCYSNETMLGTYTFSLKESSDSTFISTPPLYQFNYTKGVPCHWNSAQTARLSFLHQ